MTAIEKQYEANKVWIGDAFAVLRQSLVDVDKALKGVDFYARTLRLDAKTVEGDYLCRLLDADLNMFVSWLGILKDGYSEEWLNEAVNVRHLPNLVSTPDALPEYITPQSVALFEKFRVYSELELKARTEVLLENYSKVLNIEALTMIDMVRKKIIPAVFRYTKDVCDTGASKEAMGITAAVEKDLAGKLSTLTEGIYKETAVLEEKVIAAQDKECGLPSARYYRDVVFAQMQTLRAIVDETETIVSEDIWPLPSYTTLLFSV